MDFLLLAPILGIILLTVEDFTPFIGKSIV